MMEFYHMHFMKSYHMLFMESCHMLFMKSCDTLFIEKLVIGFLQFWRAHKVVVSIPAFDLFMCAMKIHISTFYLTYSHICWNFFQRCNH
jgi:hypothetical protein